MGEDADVAWPATPPAWLLPWAIWRFRGEVGPKPTGTPKEIPKWSWAVLKWCSWKRKGSPPPRPSGLPVRIPQWAWQLYKLLGQAVPVTPPPPPPPPPPPVPETSWGLPLPLVLFGWGTKLDWTTSAEWTPIVQRHADAGVGTAALQITQSAPWQAEILRSYGIKVAMWGVASSEDQAALDSHEADGYIPQVEGAYERDPALDSLSAGVGAGLSRAIVTTFAGLEEGQMAWFEGVGCSHAFVETYSQTGGNRGDVPVMMHQARIYGIQHADPVPAIYWDVPLSSYDLDAHGRQIAVWSGEYFAASDFAELKAL